MEGHGSIVRMEAVVGILIVEFDLPRGSPEQSPIWGNSITGSDDAM
jgi:hypothetical protein